MNKTTKLTAVLSVLCLCAVVNYAVAAPASSYVGVSERNTFEYTYTIARNTMPSNLTFDATLTIDNVTDNEGNATIGMHLFM
ncbi:MAG: hypothetical protein RBG13Loki_1872 [Promethearchaeota archaeon CR_4]|nr:MAG: hypothetical protein RBG13Loki_1872 [Candidatus Lokiarchaeota archaeon CR_4]